MSFSDLPLLSELLDSHRCKVGPTCTCGDKTKHKPLEDSDNRLKHWEEWMSKRKNMHKKLGSMLRRKPGELVMNSADEFRGVRESQLTIDYAKIPKPDKQRGCPGFWKVPLELASKNPAVPPCHGLLTHADKCEVPVLEQVSVAVDIMKEKDILPRAQTMTKSWEKSAYLKRRKAALRPLLEKVAPHKPEAEELLIKGTRFGRNKAKAIEPEIIPSVKSKGSQTLRKSLKLAPKSEPSYLILSVNDLQLSPDLDLTGTRKMYTFFDYDINCKQVVTEYLHLQNLGTMTIRFSWESRPAFSLFRNWIPQKEKDNCFYFDKNTGLILPGQKLEFPFRFKTDKAGVYFEQWELNTRPNVIPENLKIIVTLHASAGKGDLNEKMAAIKDSLDNKLRNRLIKESLSAVLNKVPYVKTKPTVYSYNKREVFEAVNSKFNAINQTPNYLYNKDVVRELQRFYKTIRRPTDPKVWNYYVDELRLLTKIKDKEAEKLQKIRDEQSILLEQRDSQVSTITQESVLRYAPFQFTFELEEILVKLEKPKAQPNYERDKFVLAYNIFSSFFTKIDNDLEELKERFGIIKVCRYPKLASDYTPFHKTPTRLLQETLQDIFQGPQLRQSVGLSTDKPPAESLLHIPKDDFKMRFRTYYNMTDTPHAKAETGGKGSTSEAKKFEPESDEDDGIIVDHEFNPYADVPKPPPHVSPRSLEEEAAGELVSNLGELSPRSTSMYSRNIYVIVYKHLENAIMNVVDMLEIQPQEHLPYPVIKEIKNNDYVRRLIDLKGLIAQEAMDKANAKLILDGYRKQSKKNWEALELKKQLKRTPSDMSLWSVLREHRPKPVQLSTKPISYQMDHYGKEGETTVELQKPLVQATTSTSDAKIDHNLEDFKEVGVQKDYGEDDQEVDLTAYVEKVVSELTLNDLDDVKVHKETQKEFDDHVSDEEYFFDLQADDVSIDSEPDDYICDDMLH